MGKRDDCFIIIFDIDKAFSSDELYRVKQDMPIASAYAIAASLSRADRRYH